MRATCFGLLLGHHQACKYKNYQKENKLKWNVCTIKVNLCCIRRSKCSLFFIIIIIIIIVIIIIISFMQGIYTYIPETNNVPREYTVAAILLLLFMVPISLIPALALLCFNVSTFRSMYVVPIWLFSVVL
jgi:hypothetical protein